jgi:hypothetical protein
MKDGIDLILSMIYFGRKYVFDSENYEIKEDFEFKNNTEFNSIFNVLKKSFEGLIKKEFLKLV